MYWLVTWVDEEGVTRERDFHYSTQATEFASELHSASGASIVRVDTWMHCDSDACTVCGHGLEHHKQADACRFEDCRCAGYDDGHSVHLRNAAGDEPGDDNRKKQSTNSRCHD